MDLSLARYEANSLRNEERLLKRTMSAAILLGLCLTVAPSFATQAPAAKPQGRRTPLELLQAAHTLFLQQDYEAAREHYLEVLPSFPKNFEVLKNLAYCFYQRGPSGYAQAASYYSKALEIEPDSIEVAENLARCLVGLNRHGEAGEIYEDMASQPGGAAINWKRAAEAYAAANRIGPAEAAFDAYLERSPGDLDARTRLGDLYTSERKYAEARKQYELVLSSNANYPRALVGLGRLASWQGHYEEALKYLDRALSVSPRNGEAQTAKAFALLWLERFEESRTLFQDLQKRFPRSAEIARGLEQADAALRQKELVEARRAGDTEAIQAYYRDRLERDPNDVSALRVLADATATPGLCKDSIEMSRKGLELSPGDSGFQLRLARSLALCQQYDEAIGHYRRVLQAEPKSSSVLGELGSTLLRAGRGQEAIEPFRQALEISPENTDAKLGLALALASNREYDEALGIYEEVLKTSPDNYDALQGKAFILSWTGHPDESRAIFQSLAKRNPDDPQNKEALDRIASAEETAKWTAMRPATDASPQDWLAYYNQRLAAYPDDLTALKGRAYQLSLMDDTSAAIQAYRQVLAKDPEDTGGKRILARLLTRDQQYDGAVRLYQEVLATTPNDEDSLENLARVQGWAGQDRASLESYQKLLAAHPSNTSYQMEVARLQLKLNETASAQGSLERVLAADPQNRDAHIELARLDMEDGNRASALSHYEAVLEQNPHDPAALFGQAQIAYYQGQLKQAHAAASEAVAAEPNSFDGVFLLASIEHARGRRRQTRELLDRADAISPGNPAVLDMRSRMRDEFAVTMHTTTSYAREIGPAGEATLEPVGGLLDETTVTGLPNEDVRYQTYGATIGVPLTPKLDSYFSFTSLPTQSPTPSIQGAVAPWTFLSRFSWRPSQYLTLRGGAGLTRFGPSDILRQQDLTGDLANLVDRFGPSVTDQLGIMPSTIPGQGFKPAGLAGATISPSRKFTIDLDWNQGPAIYYPTPRAMKLHLIQTRFDGTLNFYFTPRTELHFNFFYTRLFTDSSVTTSDFVFIDPTLLDPAAGPDTPLFYTAPVPDTPLSAQSCPNFLLNNGALANPIPIAITSAPSNLVCAVGEVSSMTAKKGDWGHGGAITFNQIIVQSERFSLDGGYQGTAYGFAGQRVNVRDRVFFGFFNPTFYQSHLVTGRIYGRLYGPVSYDLSGGLGLQQINRIDELTLTSVSGALTRASKVTPAFSFKVSPNLTIGIAYTHYNVAQVLGPLSGNVFALTTDWRF